MISGSCELDGLPSISLLVNSKSLNKSGVLDNWHRHIKESEDGRLEGTAQSNDCHWLQRMMMAEFESCLLTEGWLRRGKGRTAPCWALCLLLFLCLQEIALWQNEQSHWK